MFFLPASFEAVPAFSTAVPPAQADSSVISLYACLFGRRPDPCNNAMCLEIVGLCREFLVELAILLCHLQCF